MSSEISTDARNKGQCISRLVLSGKNSATPPPPFPLGRGAGAGGARERGRLDGGRFQCGIVTQPQQFAYFRATGSNVFMEATILFRTSEEFAENASERIWSFRIVV